MYEQMYAELFNAVSKALELIEQSAVQTAQVQQACDMLKAAQLSAEQLFIACGVED